MHFVVERALGISCKEGILNGLKIKEDFLRKFKQN
jgi:hypothetical protein